MEQGTAQAVIDIRETRERIGESFHELEERLPEPAVVARRAAGILAGTGLGGAAFWFAVRKIRSRRREKKEQERLNVIFNVVPPDFAKRIAKSVEEGRWRGWAAGAAGAWVLFRMAELRQLRMMRRSIGVR